MNYTSREVYEFTSRQTQDPIVERKTCEISGTEFAIFQSDLDFYNKISPTFNGKKYQIPTPKLCPEERERRRMAWRNERKLFRRKCDSTGEDIISMYPPETTFPVYSAKTRWGDSRNPKTFAQNLDNESGFNDQFQKLLSNVPRLYMYNLNAQNSDYSNCSLDMKNCYLVSGAIGNEDCLYGNYMDYCKDSVDNIMVFDSEKCYECIDCSNCHNSKYCQNTKNTKNSYFLYNCENCENCFCSVNLVNKQYCYFNQQLTKQEYDEKLSKINLGSYNTIQKINIEFKKFSDNFPRSATIGYNNENCIGNNPLSNSKNCFKCFDASDLEDCKYLYWFRKAKDCYDVFSRGSPGERLYECVATGSNSNNCISCANIDNSNYCYYSVQCSHSHHLFGCNGLRNSKYCIFNKQYGKEDREKYVAILVDQMQKDGIRGEMLNQKLSTYSYNHSVAQEFMPLNKDKAQELGYSWYNEAIDEIKSTNNSDIFVDNISDIDDTIVNSIFKCEFTNKLFRITAQELKFYRNNNIPIPHLHPDQRYKNRLNKRAKRELYLRKCSKTGENIVSVYSSDSPFPVYKNDVFEKELHK